jgi:nitroreductase
VPTETSTSIVDALKWRCAVKKYDATKKISASNWQLLEDALQLSPSSFGMQPYRFVIVTDQKLKDELTPACFNQTQISTCSHFVVFARTNDVSVETVDQYLALIAKTRNVPLDSLQFHGDMMRNYVKSQTPEKLADWAAKQAYIALGVLMTAASALKIDNSPMEGIVPAEVDRILKLQEKGCSSLFACALGYRAEDDKYAQLAKVRFPQKELFMNF